MKKLFTFLFMIMSLGLYSQESTGCLDCAIAEGYYCGDDPANWTVYSPEGCVQASWLNDGWVDCIDGGDETTEDGVPAVATTISDCSTIEPCDTIYVDVPVIEYVDVFITDTLYFETFITDTLYIDNFITEYVYLTDTVTLYSDADTLYIDNYITEYIYETDTIYQDVIEYVEIFNTDTIYVDVIEYIIEYVEVLVTDTIIEIEYVDIFITEFIDCVTGMPCDNSAIMEVIEKSQGNNVIFNLLGQQIKEPEGIYIEQGLIKYKIY
mgnify:CR=1 FL=1